jgi:hypothetical protein
MAGQPVAMLFLLGWQVMIAVGFQFNALKLA